MILLILFIVAFGFLFKVFYSFSCKMCTCDTKMEGKVVIVTGSNTGIGYETARNLAERGAKVILACRNAERATEARDKIIKSTGNTNVVFKQLDLSSLQSVRNFAKNILESESRLDVLINNAGIGNFNNSITEDNLPIQAQVNYFGPFLLTMLLLPLLKRSAPSRIINLSSILHWFGKIDVNTFHKPARNHLLQARVYSNSKLAIVLFTKKLSVELKGTGVTANSVHPGAIKTDIFQNENVLLRILVRLTFRTPWQGAQTVIYLAVAPELKDTSGKYFVNCSKASTHWAVRDVQLSNKLWDLSHKVTSGKKSL